MVSKLDIRGVFTMYRVNVELLTKVPDLCDLASKSYAEMDESERKFFANCGLVFIRTLLQYESVKSSS